jgi:hypothetical protein
MRPDWRRVVDQLSRRIPKRLTLAGANERLESGRKSVRWFPPGARGAHGVSGQQYNEELDRLERSR